MIDPTRRSGVESQASYRVTETLRLKGGLAYTRAVFREGINAGHDLTLDNLPALMVAIPDLDECSIGHALTADALKYGFPETVRRYKAILDVK